MLTTIVCVTLPGMSPFEFGVICEVFGIDRREHGGPVFDFHLTAAEPGPIRTKLGFDIVVHEDLSAAADADLIAIPAYQSGEDIHPEILRVVREAEARGAWVLSVCSGAFVLGAESAGEGTRGHPGAAGELVDRELLVEVLQHPLGDGGERVAAVLGHRRLDEL
jgi:transcriptional regulator GlxA family with amidase domain